jgi:hypothetical protein
MTIMANILQGDRTDTDLIQFSLEILTNLMTYDKDNDQGRKRARVSICFDHLLF